MKNLDDLPDELLVEIFTLVHPFDRRSLSLVSSRFRRIAWDPSLAVDRCCFIHLKDERIEENDFDYEKLSVSMPDPKTLHRSNFLAKRGKNIYSLRIVYESDTLIEKDIWYCALKFTPNLERLLLCFPGLEDVQQFKKPIKLSLPNVRVLQIVANGAQEEMSILTKFKFPKLESLELTFFMDFFNPERISVILKLLNGVKSTLKQFTFFCDYDCIKCEFGVSHLIKMIMAIGPQLEELRLPKTPLSSEIIETVSTQFPNLKMFAFSYNTPLENLRELRSKLPRLMKIRFMDKDVSPQSLSCVHNYCLSVSEIFGRQTLPANKNLSAILDAPNYILKHVLEMTPTLRILKIGTLGKNEKERMDNETVKIIAQNCPTLRCLEISGSEQVTDVNSLRLIKGLIWLHLDNFINLTDAGLARLAIPELRSLEITYCPKVTKNGLSGIFSRCLALRRFVTSDKSLTTAHTPRSQELVKISMCDEDSSSWGDVDSDEFDESDCDSTNNEFMNLMRGFMMRVLGEA